MLVTPTREEIVSLPVTTLPLMERLSGGILVELYRVNGRSVILVNDLDGEGDKLAFCDGRELEAFDHPYLFV